VILSLPCFVYVGAFAGEAIALGDDPSLNHKRGTILKGMPRLLTSNLTNRNVLTLAGFPPPAAM
jgi:hypothetical protein